MIDGPEDRFRLVGSVVGGRYAVERPAARGGGGIVYRATHVELAAPVALKVLVVPEHLRGADGSLVARFRREARTLAELRHPAVVRVLDVSAFDAGGEACVWMALEWLDGATLDAHLLARGGRGCSPREALALLAPVLDGIASAHAHGVAHRDLKPTNLMAVPSRGDGVELRVLDFGIAKAMEPDELPGTGLTETRSDHGSFSLPYAAPEQVGRLRTGPWTDVHALGLILTECLTSRAPYAGDDSFALYAAVMSPERPTPARFGVDVGPWEAALAKAMALHPAERFPDAGALYAALSASVDEAQRAWERPPASTPSVAPTEPRPEPSRARRVGRWALVLAASLTALTLAFAASRFARTPSALPAQPSPSPRVAPPPPTVAVSSRAPTLAAPPVLVAPAPVVVARRPDASPARVARPPSRVRAARGPTPPDDPDRIVME